ncbi:AAA family ATPase [Nonomuraea endophytica]|uniref:Nuclease SbcCD subunit C n=1 Tax=Nonomuraea endophytica TaxID=714136 RepID=A0A7W8A4N4_9ACTN|nr:AAA family ATPase [Nonomuraea endophytica]MBB5078198.1 exonuclease SbcC [Nonomuraea endophytica]
MRPHLLTLTAFGSFPGTETVSFDALTEAGLFLVHGPTGAGKTTVLDALCFALFGKVANAQRDSARSLRCDHAPPDVGPSVTLEATLRGRLLRIERSPAWQRPKRRGTGFTEEKAKVIVQERTGSSWTGLTTRADEAGDLIGGLLGMNADQFCQVAMLPQGDFARFLRSDGDDRRRLLERLFTVKVYTQAESWLAERRKQAWRDQQELRQQVDFAIQRIEEAAGDDLTPLLFPVGAPVEVPGGEQDALFDLAEPSGEQTAPAEPPTVTGLFTAAGSPTVVGSPTAAGQAEAVEPPTAEDDPLGWAGGLLAAARAVVAGAADRQAGAESALRRARSAYEVATALAERQRRHAAAVSLRRTLDERAEERADLQALLDDATRADRVLPLVTAARQRAEAAAKTRTLAADAIARARPLLPTDDAPTSDARTSDARTSDARTSDARTSDGRVAEARVVEGRTVEARLPGRQGQQGRRGAGVDDPELPGRLAALERERHDESARLSELLTEEARLSVIRRDLARVEDELTALVTDDESTTARLAGLPALIEQAEGLLAQSRVDAARVPAAEAVRAAVSDILDTDRELVRLAAQLDTLTRRQNDLSAAAADLPGKLAEAKAALARVRTEAATVPAAVAARDAARAVLEAARRRDALTGELHTATAALKHLVDEAQRLRERWLDLRQARLDGMAAELARDLSSGAPCAVCGSLHHPDPASPAPTAPSPDDEHAAESAHEAALSRREAAELAIATLETRLTTATEAAHPAHPHPWAPSHPSDEHHLDSQSSDEQGLVRELSDGRVSGVDGSPVAGGASTCASASVDGMSGDVPVVRAVVAAGGGSAGDVGQGRGLSVEDAQRAVREAGQEVDRLRAVAEREPGLAAEVERIEGQQQRAAEQAREVGEAIAAQRTHHTQLAAERARLINRLPAITTPGTDTAPDNPASGHTAHTDAASESPVSRGIACEGVPPDRDVASGSVPRESAALEAAGSGGSASAGAASAEAASGGAATEGAASAGAVSGGDGPVASGGEVVVGVQMLREAVAEVDRLRRSAGREGVLAGQVERLHQERGELEERLRRVTARVAACRTRQEELSGDAGRLAARLDGARGDDPTLAARLSRLGDEAELLREALEATARAVRAAQERDAARGEAERAAIEAEFADVDEALAAARPDEERERKAGLLRELDAQYAAVTSTLADPALVAAAGETAPDLAELEAGRERAEEEYAALVSSRDQAQARARRLDELCGELRGCLERWEPAAAAHRLAERMASLASGTSGDNQWNMSLSSFVLGERLRQVVAAANDRLDHMSGGRYQLQHDLRKTAGARGRSGGGLGLRVADGWTGVDRDPATLSGGESFITSLALALGLADVVTAEAGGAEIGTLFVDEGFGTLDEDTLDGVLDILDGLRDGGRAVGIVSHVAELRTRIPAQLRVTKTRTGSTLSVAGVSG